MISKHLDKNNLHHAYLIEGSRGDVVSEIFEFLKSIGIETVGNADVSHISLDSFKIEDARNLKSFGSQKSFSIGKKIFIVSANNFLLEAQNSLLKIFEEPIHNTHFFLIVPDINALLKTFISRFYVISRESDHPEELKKDAEKFISVPLEKRILFIKELLTEAEEGDEEVAIEEASRSKAIKFLNTLESILHNKIFIQGVKNNPKENPATMIPFRQIFTVRQFLRQPGSSVKTLMESVALVIPDFEN